MVLEVIGGAILLALGLFVIYFSVEESKHSDSKFLIVMLIGFILAIAGGWIIVSTLTLAIVLRKIGGLVLSAIGLFLMVGFPDIKDYQSFELSKAAIVIGLVLFIIGIYFFIF